MKEPIYPISIEKDNFLIAGKNNIFLLNLNEGKIVNSFHIENKLNSEIVKINDDIIVESLKDQTLLISLSQKKVISIISYEVFSIYPISIEKDNFLIAGKNNIFFLNLNEGKIVNSFHINNLLNSKIIKINDDIIVESLKDQTLLISLSQKKVTSIIKYEVFSIFPIKNHDFFLAGGKNNDIRFFNIHNGECFRGIETHGEKLIAGIIEINNGLILSYTNKGEVRIWEFCLNYNSIY